MNYKLAKKLVVAGFPMKLASPGDKDIWGGRDTAGTVFTYPTFSELIEECGGNIKMLLSIRGNDDWSYAVDGRSAEGKSPEEAVAKLWLKLNT